MGKKENPDFWRTKKNKDGSLEWEGFGEYDYKSAERELNPEERASTFAVSGKNVSDDSVLTTEEIKMLAHVNEHIIKLREWFSRGVGAIKDKINSIVSDIDVEDSLNRIRETFDSECNKAVTDFLHTRQKIFESSDLALRELRAFRIKNALEDRPAVFPESAIYHFALIFAAMVLESVANSYFFGQASDIGLLGGFTTAFLVSLGNVAFSMLAGFMFLRQINHVSMVRKVIGVAGFLVILVGLGFLHLATAHYRELLTRNPDVDIHGDVLGPLMESPFGLQDMESILLIFIGVVISAIAIWKGYTLDDRYPGYGAVYRRWRGFNDELIEQEREIKHQIADIRDEAISEGRAVLSKIKSAKKELELLRGDIEAYLSCCESYYVAARNAGEKFISTFRNIVQSIYNDQERFPYHPQLLDGDGGLEKLDPRSGQRDVETLLESSIRNLDAKIDGFPEKMEKFSDELSAAFSEITDSQNLRRLVREIPEL